MLQINLSVNLIARHEGDIISSVKEIIYDSPISCVGFNDPLITHVLDLKSGRISIKGPCDGVYWSLDSVVRLIMPTKIMLDEYDSIITKIIHHGEPILKDDLKELQRIALVKKLGDPFREYC